jgi:hypothetical protein
MVNSYTYQSFSVLFFFSLGDVPHGPPQSIPQVQGYRQDKEQYSHAHGRKHPIEREAEAVEIAVGKIGIGGR